MAKHTPAPWRITADRNDEILKDFDCDVTYAIVAPDRSGSNGNDWIVACSIGGMDDDEEKGNLDLMAASPDLLDACKYALQFIEEYDPDLTLHPSLRAKLEAAIAKAESAS